MQCLQQITLCSVIFLLLSSKFFGKFLRKIYEKLLEELSSTVGIVFLVYFDEMKIVGKDLFIYFDQ
jgi:hypothetical protein